MHKRNVVKDFGGVCEFKMKEGKKMKIKLKGHNEMALAELLMLVYEMGVRSTYSSSKARKNDKELTEILKQVNAGMK